eukprot:3033774-Rhodomonas_salina.4
MAASALLDAIVGRLTSRSSCKRCTQCRQAAALLFSASVPSDREPVCARHSMSTMASSASEKCDVPVEAQSADTLLARKSLCSGLTSTATSALLSDAPRSASASDKSSNPDPMHRLISATCPSPDHRAAQPTPWLASIVSPTASMPEALRVEATSIQARFRSSSDAEGPLSASATADTLPPSPLGCSGPEQSAAIANSRPPSVVHKASSSPDSSLVHRRAVPLRLCV